MKKSKSTFIMLMLILVLGGYALVYIQDNLFEFLG